MLPALNVTGVAHNREQPRAAIATPVAAEELVGAKGRLLHDIFCVRVVAHEPARKIVGSVQMRQNSLLKVREFIIFLQTLFSLRHASDPLL